LDHVAKVKILLVLSDEELIEEVNSIPFKPLGLMSSKEFDGTVLFED
jgi:hypothetical protein